MSRPTLILLIVFIVVLTGGGVYLWLNRDQVSQLTNRYRSTNGTADNTNSAAANTNASPTTRTLPSETRGSHTLSGKLTVAGVELKLTSFDALDSFLSEAAPQNKKFLIVFIDPLTADQVLKVKDTLNTDTHLTTTAGPIALSGLKLAGERVTNDRGYLKFVIPAGTKDVTVEFGTGQAAQRIPLSF